VSTLATTFAPPRSRARAHALFDVVAAVAGSLLIAGLAQVSIPLPFTPVPITGQTLGVLLVGAAHGPGLGAATVGLYLAWGVLGFPVFAPSADGSHEVGVQVLRLGSATGGYLWGFVLAAGLVGALSSRGWDRSLRGSIGAMLLGSIVIYAVGVPWLMGATGASLEQGLEWGLYPFVIGDVLKLLLAAGLLPLAWRLVERARGDATGT
jgi:biotin transport system substrate-specific component